MPTTTDKIGNRLRDARIKIGRSLHDVEHETRGQFKASAVGAYERGDRVIPSDKLVALARFYGIPPRRLLPYDGTS